MKQTQITIPIQIKASRKSTNILKPVLYGVSYVFMLILTYILIVLFLCGGTGV